MANLETAIWNVLAQSLLKRQAGEKGMPLYETIICDYCESPAILSFDDEGATHYVCSNEHYHLYYERKYQKLIISKNRAQDSQTLKPTRKIQYLVAHRTGS
ncbi:MAG: hypothetical protein C5B54_00160 [Acidobacteria bacterium]|nr:MAG: hypothetical protein C5B54_00160 [Acidobacteriota bacterium]